MAKSKSDKNDNSKKKTKKKKNELPEVISENIDFDPNIKEAKSKMKAKQLRHSNFYLTLNTNQRFIPTSKEYKIFNDKFCNVIDRLLDKSNLHNVIVLKDKNANYTKEYIPKIDIQKVVELGEEKNCVHMHALVLISHYTSVNINYSYISDFVKNQMDLKNVYFNCKVVKENINNLKDYLKKGEKKKQIN